MRTILPFLLISSVVVATGNATSPSWFEADDETCGEATTTLEIVECYVDLHDIWDARLNAAYRQAVDRNTEDRRADLRAAQRAWVTFRDANCDFYRGGEGTIAGIEASLCLYGMTRERAIELEEHLRY